MNNINKKPLVVSLQRTGFSLLINLISEIKKLSNPAKNVPPVQLTLNKIIPFISHQLNLRYRQFFDKHGLGNELLYNGEFQLLIGGPKWVDEKYPDDIFIRKYFGVKDKGDFLLVVRYPKSLFDYYSIKHSTKGPEEWIRNTDNNDYNFLTSYRNPMGVFNSAVHSINALTSEYIQRYLPTEDEENLRAEIALNKLSDPDVCEGLIKYQLNYWNKYFNVANKFSFYRWEDLITNPIETIQEIALMVGQQLTKEEALKIWQPRDHKNLLGHHLHNYRKNKGIVGDWKEKIINEHIDIFLKYGGDKVFNKLGYKFPQKIPIEQYTDFQKKVKKYWDAQEAYQITDKNLYGFAFNKSNIDASKFNFDSLPVIDRVEIERSTFFSKELLIEFQRYVEELTSEIVIIVNKILNSSGTNKEVTTILFEHFEHDNVRSFMNVLDSSKIELFHKLEQYILSNTTRKLILWGLGSDFDFWRENSSSIKNILTSSHVELVDRERQNQIIEGKKVMCMSTAQTLKGALFIPITINYETRRSMEQFSQFNNMNYIDVFAMEVS